MWGREFKCSVHANGEEGQDFVLNRLLEKPHEIHDLS